MASHKAVTAGAALLLLIGIANMTEADAPAPSGHEQASPATPGPLHESEPPSSAPAPSTVEVPDVSGLSLSRATTRLENAGLQVAVKKEYSKQDAGTVLDLAPGDGAEVTEGRTVTVVIGEGVP